MPSFTLREAADLFLARPTHQEDEPREINKFVSGIGSHIAVDMVLPAQIEDYQKRFVSSWNEDMNLKAALKSNRIAVAHLRVVQRFLRWLSKEQLAGPSLLAAVKLPAEKAGLAKNLFTDKSLRLNPPRTNFYHDTGLPAKAVRLGIDFGTSNTSVALFDGEQVRMLPIDVGSNNPESCPSLLYIRRTGQRSIGKVAQHEYLADNTERPHHFVRQTVGNWEYIGAEFTKLGKLDIEIDEAEPGRFFQSLKTGLRSTLTINTLLLDAPPAKDKWPTGTMYSIENLVAEFLAEVKERAEREVGSRVDEIYLGRPVHFSTDPAIDEAADTHLRVAAEQAGFRRVFMQYEPVAAALDYESRLKEPSNLLVFDFGGGTLDVTVARMGGGIAPQILSVDGVPIGGDDLDRRIMEGKLLKYFGQGVTLGPRQQEFPRHMLEKIISWQTMRELNTPEMLRWLKEVEATSSRPRVLRALRCLIGFDLLVPLYEQIEQAKIDLSSAESAAIRMFNRDIAINEPITRAEFEYLIREELRAIGECVDRVVAKAGIGPEQIDLVLRTGGSSSIPAFIRLLQDRFGPRKLVRQNVFTGIAAGLGIAGYRSLHNPHNLPEPVGVAG